VCHSYGGVPTTQALVDIGVKRIIYISAIVPSVGQNNVVALSGEGAELPMEAVVCYFVFFLPSPSSNITTPDDPLTD
jgi:hypothetical protein